MKCTRRHLFAFLKCWLCEEGLCFSVHKAQQFRYCPLNGEIKCLFPPCRLDYPLHTAIGGILLGSQSTTSRRSTALLRLPLHSAQRARWHKRLLTSGHPRPLALAPCHQPHWPPQSSPSTAIPLGLGQVFEFAPPAVCTALPTVTHPHLLQMWLKDPLLEGLPPKMATSLPWTLSKPFPDFYFCLPLQKLACLLLAYIFFSVSSPQESGDFSKFCFMLRTKPRNLLNTINILNEWMNKWTNEKTKMINQHTLFSGPWGGEYKQFIDCFMF